MYVVGIGSVRAAPSRPRVARQDVNPGSIVGQAKILTAYQKWIKAAEFSFFFPLWYNRASLIHVISSAIEIIEW